MSENFSPADDENFENMLRAVLGDEAAEHIINDMRDNGVELNEHFTHILNPGNFTQILTTVQSLLNSSDDSAVNWEMGEQIARDAIHKGNKDTLTTTQADKAREALSISNLWLDPFTKLQPPAAHNQAWSRLDYITHCLPTFRQLTEPVGTNIARAFSQALSEHSAPLPEDMFAQFGASTTQMMKSIIASLLGMQYGVGLAELAGLCFGGADTGLPLVDGDSVALVPANIAELAKDLDEGGDELELFVAVREQATARLYSQIPWLRPQILDAITAYSQQIAIDMDSIESQLRDVGFDMHNMQEIDLSGVFDTDDNDMQKAMLAKLEHTLSLVEGWVSAVSLDAVIAQLPHAIALSELLQRRSATQSPANHTFGPLVGLNIAPKRVREATAFWHMATARLGIEKRDALWNHPDFLPTPEHLENPQTFFEPAQPSKIEDELDAFLEELLTNGDSDDSQDTPKE